MDIYFTKKHIDEYDVKLLTMIFDKLITPCYIEDKVEEGMIFVTKPNWIFDIDTEVKNKISKLTNKIIYILHPHKSIVGVRSDGIKTLELIKNLLNLKNEEIFILLQLPSEIEEVKNIFPGINAASKDWWAHELYTFSALQELISSTNEFIINKRFSIFIRRFEPDRFRFMCKLIDSDLYKNFNYTFGFSAGGFQDYDIRPVHELISHIPYGCDKNKILDWIDKGPYSIGQHHEYAYPKGLPELFKTASMNIVYETHPISDGSVITEKTYKSMFYKKPALFVTQPHALKKLHNSGYKTFNHIFDETYDDIVNYYERSTAILNQIEWLNSLSDVEFNNLIDECKPILEHNYNRLFEEFLADLPKSSKISEMEKRIK